MKQTIQEKLTQISLAEPLHFLLAAESGSRAWGFASPDSDYDVRAVYIRPQEHYLQIDEAKDTFEFIENQWFDVGGWDIRKALRLLRKSNAVLLEWLRSPIVYTQDEAFTDHLNELAPQYVQAAALLHHYRGIAGNALKAMDLTQPIKLKKWFYVLRPLLAARWAVKQGGIPPMTLVELMNEWQTDCATQITDLVALKAEQNESYLHTLSPELQKLTVDLYNEVSALSATAAEPADSGPLNELFRSTLATIYP
ncbi:MULTISPECIES: nucleotidyltransferase domain-containing protein [Neisseria]|mgnify:FL=1|jgi:hypothetical protein|uniref:nucleotidyltransferase domain-containing protein n=2 Tax=Neisseriaceae TaxID=481 RepID=UPI0008A43677|nr:MULTISPECIES: nucleotidyltransferase domain-containing protein [Neisseria]OFV35890.1 hypothetical protein HMPREF3139_00725 [Neisseria sp. HMSC15G01]